MKVYGGMLVLLTYFSSYAQFRGPTIPLGGCFSNGISIVLFLNNVPAKLRISHDLTKQIDIYLSTFCKRYFCMNA